MAFNHFKWEKSGRTSYNSDTGQFRYESSLGEQQVWNGLGSSPSKRWWRIIVPHECEKRIWDGQMHAKAGSR